MKTITQHIKGYTKANGTKVQGYNREITIKDVNYTEDKQEENKSLFTSIMSAVVSDIVLDNEIERHIANTIVTLKEDNEAITKLLGMSDNIALNINIQKMWMKEGSEDFNVRNFVNKYEVNGKLIEQENKHFLYTYIKNAQRFVHLSTIADRQANNKTLNSRITATFKAIVEVISASKEGRISYSSVLNKVAKIFRPYHINGIYGQIEGGEQAGLSLAVQFISELTTLGYVKLDKGLNGTAKVQEGNRTHVLLLTFKSKDLINKSAINELSLKQNGKHILTYSKELLSTINKKTILTDKPKMPNKLIGTSSWFYKDVDLSKDMIKFIKKMNSIKFEFVTNDRATVKSAYEQHLADDKGYMPKDSTEKSIDDRVDLLLKQINASMDAKGHHVAGQCDSALRYYFNAELGHKQLSSPLRSLVKIQGIENPYKVDMSNNITQIYSTLTGSKSLAKYVGLVDATESREDLRLVIAKKLNQLLNVTSFNKNNIKPIFMIWAYNAEMDMILDGSIKKDDEGNNKDKSNLLNVNTVGLLRVISENIKGDDKEAVKQRRAVINCNKEEREEIFSKWTNMLNLLVPEIVAIKEMMAELLKANPFSESSWTLADGGIAQYANVDNKEQLITWVDSDNKTKVHTHYYKEIKTSEKKAGLLPRIIHSIDAWFMRQLVIRAPFIVVPNHDSFIFDGTDENKVIVDTLMKDLYIEILEGTMLEDIVNELNVSKEDIEIVRVTKDRLTAEDIRKGTPAEEEEM